jgi:hypothetical protein
LLEVISNERRGIGDDDLHRRPGGYRGPGQGQRQRQRGRRRTSS